MWQRLVDSMGPFRRFANGAAWFFIVFSLAHLAWVIAVKTPHPGGLATLYQTTVGETTYRAPGLAYDGWGGLLLAILQILAVLSAAVFSVLPFARPRRLAHGFLMMWSAWWFVNLLRLASLDHQVDSILQALLLGFLFVCTAQRALPRGSRGTGAPPTVFEETGGDGDALSDEDHLGAPLEEPGTSRLGAIGRRLRRLPASAREGLHAGQRTMRRRAAAGLDRVAEAARRRAGKLKAES